MVEPSFEPGPPGSRACPLLSIRYSAVSPVITVSFPNFELTTDVQRRMLKQALEHGFQAQLAKLSFKKSMILQVI